MRPAFAITAALALAALGQVQMQAQAQVRPQRPVSLFDGESLDGWRGDPVLWSVVDGVITGVTEAAGEREIGQNSSLIYAGGEVDDFDLTLKARVTGENNSGIHYRSRVIDEEGWIVTGYQLGLHPRQDQVGMVYEERGRGILARRGSSTRIGAEETRLIGPLDRSEEIDIAVWNEYSISARGSRLTHKVNGKVTATVVDDDVARRSLAGVLALQLGAGAPMKLEVKDIVLRRHNRTRPVPPDGEPGPEPARPAAQWITHGENPHLGDSLFFRRIWQQESAATDATLRIAADGEFAAYLNGREILSGDVPGKVYTFELSEELATVSNTLAVRLRPGDAAGGLAARLDLTLRDGSSSSVVSDRLWISHAGTEAPASWKTELKARRLWTQCRPIQDRVAPFAPAATEEATPARLTPPPGFKLDKIYETADASGDPWNDLVADDRGHLFAFSSSGKVYQIARPGGDEPAKVEEIDFTIQATNGLLHAFNSFFVALRRPYKSGLYRVGDADGDGQFESLASLRESATGDGPHALVLGNEPLSLFVLYGKTLAPPDDLFRSRPPAIWGNDQLLPFPVEEKPDLPGGWIAKLRPDGREWELHAVGLHQARGLAINRHGDLFTCDAGTPDELGLPSHRPAALYHIPMGADLGARAGGQHFPAEYPDTLAPVIELDPGSPGAMTFGAGAAFPARYQEALFICDRSRGAIDVIHLEPAGTSYRATRESFVASAELSITGIAIATDGAMYFSTGGDRSTRPALWRITYTGDEDKRPTKPAPLPADIARQHALLRKIGKLQGKRDPRVIATVWPQLGSQDRLLRHAARTAIEHHDPDLWLPRFEEESRPAAVLEAAVALTRTGGAAQAPVVAEKLATLDFARLSALQKISFLRAHGLAFIRLAAPDTGLRSSLIGQIAPHFPSGDQALDLELCRMLTYLGEPGIIEESLPLMAAATDPSLATAYAAILNHAKDGWTPAAKANYLAWLEKSIRHPASDHHRQFLERLKTRFSREGTTKTNE